MLVTIRDLADLTNYIAHIDWALTHHAEHLREIAPHIAWGVLSARDPERAIEVHERRSQSGRPAIAAAIWFAGRRYCLAYNRRMGSVVTLREGSRVGPIIWTFTEETVPADVRAVFETLRASQEVAEVA